MDLYRCSRIFLAAECFPNIAIHKLGILECSLNMCLRVLVVSIRLLLRQMTNTLFLFEQLQDALEKYMRCYYIHPVNKRD